MSRWVVFAFCLGLFACGGSDAQVPADVDAGSDADDAGQRSCDREGLSPATELAERDTDLALLFYTAATQGNADRNREE